jgi:DNA processing protein
MIESDHIRVCGADDAVHAETLPPEAYLASLAGFDRMTTKRLSSLLFQLEPAAAFAVATGDERPPPQIAALLARDSTLAAAWRDAGARRDPHECWQQCLAAGIAVVARSDPRYPAQLLDDPTSPPVLFARGDLSALDARRVGIVGTRNATQRGRETAAEFGFELAAQGVTVVSGLAKGIDGAAHRGALAVHSARPVAVVGNGPDTPYPKQHASLWAALCERGLVLSEWPPGTPPDAFRFPLRNRILAGLVEVLVVVESRERGGSLITAREAADRGVDVFAVPGPVNCRASAGTNQLLCDGAAPATTSDELMMALGLDQRRAGRARFDPRALPRGEAAEVVALCRTQARTIDQVMLLLGLSLSDSAMALARLEHQGWLRETGGWFETIDAWSDLARPDPA